MLEVLLEEAHEACNTARNKIWISDYCFNDFPTRPCLPFPCYFKEAEKLVGLGMETFWSSERDIGKMGYFIKCCVYLSNTESMHGQLYVGIAKSAPSPPLSPQLEKD